MAHYTNVTKQDIEEVLVPQGFKQITLPKVTELVYAKRVDRDGLQLALRIYTGIEGEQSRGCGEDAMRAAVFIRLEDGAIKMIGGSKRVNRVEGWRANLQSRIDHFAEQIGPRCECGSLMVERKGKHGKFYSCVNYPKCTRTLSKAS